jgi:hypothetical protein
MAKTYKKLQMSTVRFEDLDVLAVSELGMNFGSALDEWWGSKGGNG